jgi:hypothetical protein
MALVAVPSLITLIKFSFAKRRLILLFEGRWHTRVWGFAVDVRVRCTCDIIWVWSFLLHNQISAGFSEVIYTPTSLRKQTDPS